jgi:hypothetical protein
MKHFGGWNSRASWELVALTLVMLMFAPPWTWSQERLNPAKLEENEKKVLEQLAKGREDVTDAHKKLLDKAAQWFVYRLTFSEYQFKSNPEGGDPTTMRNLVDDVAKYIVVANPQKPMSDFQRNYMKAFAEALVVHIKKVLANPVPIARVNAAIILAHLGDTGLQELVDPLCDVVESKDYDDPVKLYGLVGLKNLLKAQAYPDDNDKTIMRYKRLKEETETRCIKVLLQFLARKPTYGPNASPEEVEAFRYIRREAISALGWIHVPAVMNGTAVVAVPALELTRIVADPGSLTPRASLSEQLAAAVSLCKLQNRLAPERSRYQQDYAAYHVAQLLVNFATQAEAERSNAGSVMDWKYAAYRLNEALIEIQRDSQGRSKYINDLVSRSNSILANIQKGERPEQLARLSDWLEQTKPPSMELFKGLPNTEVKIAEPAAEK